MANKNIRVQIDELFRESLDAIWIGIPPAIVDVNILTIPPTKLLEPSLEYDDTLADIGVAFSDCHQNTKAPHPLGLLGARHQRPGNGTTHKAKKFPSPHRRPRGLNQRSL